MARLNQTVDSDDEFPELSTLFRKETPRKAPNSSPSPRKENTRAGTSPTKNSRPISKQRLLDPLSLASANSRLLSGTEDPFKAGGHGNLGNECSAGDQRIRSSPRRLVKTSVDYSKFASRLSDTSLSFPEEDKSCTDLSGFIVPDSASDDEVLPSKSLRRIARPYAGKSPFQSCKESERVDLVSPKKKKKSLIVVCSESPPADKNPLGRLDFLVGIWDADEPFGMLRFAPPRSKSLHKSKETLRPITPPSSPTKSRIQSPSKKHRIPPTPHRPSVDAFWSQEVINDWNEQYSPRKVLKTPRKFSAYSVIEDEDELSPSAASQRSPVKTPAKRNKEAVLRRKAFDEKKHELATSFLAEVDQTIAQGQVTALAEPTGGIKTIWSKKLSSTAGRANWRREHIRTKSADGTISTTTYRHHASIELAEKVIDDEDRLMNVIAHEYCHLANFMISGIKDNPHGKEFREWAKKCTIAFSHRNINVTTKHAYTIAYKYIWICASCELEYKRHSKSIDPTKHTCGSCKGKLVQVQPAPRKGQAEGKRSEYQEFVKREHNRVRFQNPGKGFGEIITILGREFRESKKAKAVEKGETKSEVAAAEGREDGEDEEDDLDAVVRKLDFVNLAS